MESKLPAYENKEERYSILTKVELDGLFFNSKKIIELITPKCCYSDIGNITKRLLLEKFGTKYVNHIIETIEIAKPKTFVIFYEYMGRQPDGDGINHEYSDNCIIENVYDKNEAEIELLKIIFGCGIVDSYKITKCLCQE